MLSARQIIQDRFPDHHAHVTPEYMYPQGDRTPEKQKREPRELDRSERAPVKVRCGCGKLLKFSERQNLFNPERRAADRANFYKNHRRLEMVGGRWQQYGA